jgi:hypothetical protein
VLTTVEHKLGSKVVSLTLGVRRKHKTTVTVAQGTLTVPSGQTLTLTLTLNATGKRLLKRFGKLPVKGTTTLTDSSPPTVIGGATHVFMYTHKR